MKGSSCFEFPNSTQMHHQLTKIQIDVDWDSKSLLTSKGDFVFIGPTIILCGCLCQLNYTDIEQWFHFHYTA
jgi:hypothetical protein